MTQPIRYRADTGYEYRCEDCRKRGDSCWWPLGPECWDHKRGFVRCRACHERESRERVRRARLDPVRREADRAYAAAYYADMAPNELRAMRAKKLAYQREWMRQHRARQREQAA